MRLSRSYKLSSSKIWVQKSSKNVLFAAIFFPIKQNISLFILQLYLLMEKILNLFL